MKFGRDTQEGKLLAQWWQDLNRDKKTRAELRRCESSSQVAFVPGAVRAMYGFAPLFDNEQYSWQGRLAFILGISAHLNENASEMVLSEYSVAQYMASQKGGRPLVSELRFERLLRFDRKDLYVPMIRTIRLLERKASIYLLANAIFHWNDTVRKRWAYDYYNA